MSSIEGVVSSSIEGGRGHLYIASFSETCDEH